MQTEMRGGFNIVQKETEAIRQVVAQVRRVYSLPGLISTTHGGFRWPRRVHQALFILLHFIDMQPR